MDIDLKPSEQRDQGPDAEDVKDPQFARDN